MNSCEKSEFLIEIRPHVISCMAQSVLKIGSALAERVGQGEVGGCTALADSALNAR